MELKKTPLFTGVNSIFRLLATEKSLMVTQVDQMWNSIIEGAVRIDGAMAETEVSKNPKERP